MLRLHRDGIKEHGGASGILDRGLVESAVAAVRNAHLYKGASLVRMAAIYMYRLCRDHPFADGNKRVALRAADVFLTMNGLELTLTNDEAHDVMVRVAAGNCSEEELAAIIGSKCRPLD